MYNKVFFGTFDITVLVLYLFFAFFLGLVLYLQAESTREGFPLEDDVTGEKEAVPGIFFRALPKPYEMADGSVRLKPDGVRDTHDVSYRKTAQWSGAPIEPVGNPMTAGVGPGSYAMRADVPDMTTHGITRIAPLRIAPDYSIDPLDAPLKGMKLIGKDNKNAGTITDVWVDRCEFMVRYLEVATIDGAGASTGHTVLVPMTMCTVRKSAGTVRLDPVLASQVAGGPQLANPEQVTLLEEEKIIGYFGAGYLYATKDLAEPIL